MSALVVLAHPAARSLSRRFADLAVTTLVGSGKQPVFVDLYAEGFDPRLTAAERASYYAQAYDDRDTRADADLLTAAETLVLVFPTWWFGPPAILKGWIDRVFSPGTAFDHGRNFGPIVPRLTKLRHVVIVTSLGSPWWVDWLVMRHPVRRMLKLAVTGACAPSARVTYLALHAAETVSEARLLAFESRLASSLR